MSVRQTDSSITFDEEHGCNRIVYLVETDRGFYKIAFVADDNRIYATDVYQ